MGAKRSPDQRTPVAVDETNRPNLLFVFCDQLRRSALGHEGDPNCKTPHLDALADNGVRFANACSTNPVCGPARFTLLTGQYSHSRLADNGYRLSPAEHTIANAFGADGYRTGYIGKWHLHGVSYGPPHRAQSNRTPIPEGYRGGFDDWRGFELRNDPYDTTYFRDNDPDPKLIDGHQTDGLTDLAIEYLQNVEPPFFTIISYEAPHPPFVPPPGYVEKWESRQLELPSTLVDAMEGPPPEGYGIHSEWGDVDTAINLHDRPDYHREAVLDDLRGYYGMIEHIDDNIGRLLDRLEETGLREDTIVVFSSDHGEMLGSHGRVEKMVPYEESIGIPLIVSGPGIGSGVQLDVPTCSEDWYPTLLGLAGIDTESDLPGANLAVACRGGQEPDRPGVPLEFGIRPSVGSEPETNWPQWRGFRTRRYKYTVRNNHPWQLFDLETDPDEVTNRIDDPEYESVAERLHGHLARHLRESVDTYTLAPAFGHDAVNAEGLEDDLG